MAATQDPPPDHYAPAPERLVLQCDDGVLVRYRGTGWYEVELAEIAGCRLGNGLPPSPPTP